MIASVRNANLLLVTLALANISLVFGQQLQAQPLPAPIQPATPNGANAAVNANNNQQGAAVASIAPAVPALSAASAASGASGASGASAATATSEPQHKAVWPMVDIDRSNNKSNVDVHVPVFFDMTNHNDPQSGKSKLDLSVMQGLVTVSKDKQRGEDGQMTGPVKVTVFGIPVYQGKSQQAASNGEHNLHNTIGSVQTAVRSGVEATHDSVLGSLSGIFNRVASFAHRATSSL